jgi:hypothetical protein
MPDGTSAFSATLSLDTPEDIPVTIFGLDCALRINTAPGASPHVTLTGQIQFDSLVPGGAQDRLSVSGIAINGITTDDFQILGGPFCQVADFGLGFLMGTLTSVFEDVLTDAAQDGLCGACGDALFGACPPPAGPGGPLVINEVDYDQVGTDAGEFVEIYNPGPAPVSLDGVAVVFVNGADNAEYQRINLNGTLNPGSYAVIAAPTLTVQNGALVFRFALDENSIQNGSPDGIAIIDTATNTVLDAVSYEGSITTAVITGIGAASLVEGTPLPIAVVDSNTVPGSLARMPNGQDTNNAASDWVFTTIPTPGGPNQ